MMTLDTTQIGWRGHQGTVFMSDLPLQMWPTVLSLRSHKTGKVVQFYCTDLKRDQDGDIRYGIYRSVNFSPTLGLTVFND